MTVAVIIPGATCRWCSKPIPAALVATKRFGNAAAGYTCPACIVKDAADQAQFDSDLSAASAIIHDLPGIVSHPCQICGGLESEYYRAVKIDNRLGYVCASPVIITDCEMTWARGHRKQIGPIAEYGLKLR